MNSTNAHDILEKSVKSGLSGAGAMTIQVSSLMWLRTTMNYQYKFGGKMLPTIQHLYKEGGVPRFYRGIVPALMVGPLSRFGDTAANSVALNYFKDSKNVSVPLFLQTGSASIMAGLWRFLTIPIDTWKTAKQVHGSNGAAFLSERFRTQGVAGFYQGALAASTSTAVGHYPWFLTFNYANAHVPQVKYKDDPALALSRNAAIGFSATLVSDTVSNSVRVVKTYKQTHTSSITYSNVIKNILDSDGIHGLLFRGLKTKIITNGIQGVVFSVFYKLFTENA
jgi:Mitochondrial carrier protein